MRTGSNFYLLRAHLPPPLSLVLIVLSDRVVHFYDFHPFGGFPYLCLDS